ncbi:MAG: hypothetical protein NVS1B14_01350 [Vulcanimicrobiaceae bacterium]
MQHLKTEELTDYLHNALEPARDASIHAHLEDCVRCRDAYAAEMRLSEFLRSQAALEERELPPMLKASIWQAIRTLSPSPIERLQAWLRPAYAIPVAAVIAAAAVFGPAYLQGTRDGAPTIEAAYYLQDHAAMNTTVPFGDHSGATTSEFETTSNLDQTAVSTVPVVRTADAAH